jgi:hypothetical protein
MSKLLFLPPHSPFDVHKGQTSVFFWLDSVLAAVKARFVDFLWWRSDFGGSEGASFVVVD